MKTKTHLQLSIVLLLTCLLSACVSNQAWRSTNPDCAKCGYSFLPTRESDDHGQHDHEIHPHTEFTLDDGVSLAFVEFSELGNLFDRNQYNQTLEKIKGRITDQGVSVVAFVHGWQNNAQVGNANVNKFVRMLNRLKKVQPFDSKPLVGVYIGWRGQSVSLPGATALTYFGRKAAAQEIGKGGATEVLLDLERLTSCGEIRLDACSSEQSDRGSNDNIFVTVGHSFGSAVVLSAVNEILLNRLSNPIRAEGDERELLVRPFGNGIVLLNPAIEANEMNQLRELVSRYNFNADQPVLIHIVASDGDNATRRAFKWAQRLSWFNNDFEEVEVSREQSAVKEAGLHNTTVGNYQQFWTGQMIRARPRQWLYLPITGGCDGYLKQVPVDTEKPANNGKRVNSCIQEINDLGGNPDLEWFNNKLNADPKDGKRWQLEKIEGHVPSTANHPVQVIYTDGHFIEDHSDIFQNVVFAYAVTIVQESRHLRASQEGHYPDELVGSFPGTFPPACKIDNTISGGRSTFPFGNCFRFYTTQFSQSLVRVGPRPEDLVYIRRPERTDSFLISSSIRNNRQPGALNKVSILNHGIVGQSARINFTDPDLILDPVALALNGKFLYVANRGRSTGPSLDRFSIVPGTLVPGTLVSGALDPDTLDCVPLNPDPLDSNTSNCETLVFDSHETIIDIDTDIGLRNDLAVADNGETIALSTDKGILIRSGAWDHPDPEYKELQGVGKDAGGVLLGGNNLLAVSHLNSPKISVGRLEKAQSENSKYLRFHLKCELEFHKKLGTPHNMTLIESNDSKLRWLSALQGENRIEGRRPRNWSLAEVTVTLDNNAEQCDVEAHQLQLQGRKEDRISRVSTVLYPEDAYYVGQLGRPNVASIPKGLFLGRALTCAGDGTSKTCALIDPD